MIKTCPETMKLLGDYWTLRVVDELRNGDLRFCELQRQADNLNPVTLTSRLKKLEAAGVIERIEDLEDKVSVNYKLTELGCKALPIIDAFDDFDRASNSKRSVVA